ncbi:MAG: hypothetical protein Q4G08_03415 [Capnocytophaga sp.]|nr:hypothetical protein [Capnocytophaga sp.]
MFFCLLLLSCGASKPEPPQEVFKKITYRSSGRNYSLVIVAEAKQWQIASKRDRISQVKPMAAGLWQELQRASQNLTDSLITNTQAPSRNFTFDGGYHTQLEFVTLSDTTLTTLPFDHNRPPAVFREIITILLEENGFPEK